MADLNMTLNPQKFTNPAGTGNHTVNLDRVLAGRGLLFIDGLSGPMRFNNQGVAADAVNSALYTTGDRVPPLEVTQGTLINLVGSAGGETFQFTIVNIP